CPAGGSPGDLCDRGEEFVLVARERAGFVLKKPEDALTARPCIERNHCIRADLRELREERLLGGTGLAVWLDDDFAGGAERTVDGGARDEGERRAGSGALPTGRSDHAQPLGRGGMFEDEAHRGPERARHAAEQEARGIRP